MAVVIAARQAYTRWLRRARRLVANAAEADDLLQEALLVAFQSGRQPLVDDRHDAWFHGVLRKLAAFLARGAGRRRGREEAVATEGDTEASAADLGATGGDAVTAVRAVLADLPPAQSSVLVLVLHGLDRAEIRQVLGIADTALRQRLAALRRRLADASLGALQEPFQAWLAARNGADAGLKRATLARGPARIHGFRMGVSDPDGHLLGIHVPRRSGQ